MVISNKMCQYIKISIILIVCCTTACSSQPQNVDNTQANSNIQLYEDWQVTEVELAEITEKSTNPPYTIAVNYPKINYAQITSLSQQINERIEIEARQRVQNFVNDIQKSTRLEPQLFNGQPSTLNIKTIIGLANKNILSFALLEQYDHARAAHPTSIQTTHNINLQTGDTLRLADIFKENTAYLQKLSELCYNAIIQQKLANNLSINADLIAEATQANESSFERFMLHQHHLSIYFYAHHLSSYPSPEVWVNIAYTDVKDYLLNFK